MKLRILLMSMVVFFIFSSQSLFSQVPITTPIVRSKGLQFDYEKDFTIRTSRVAPQGSEKDDVNIGDVNVKDVNVDDVNVGDVNVGDVNVPDPL